MTQINIKYQSFPAPSISPGIWIMEIYMTFGHDMIIGRDLMKSSGIIIGI